MRSILLALPFALSPLAIASADEHAHDHDHVHGSLGAHVHGIASLNLALEGTKFEIELDSPAINLVGFEHQATSDADKAKLAGARAALEKPLTLFALPAAAACKVTEMELESPLFGDAHDHDHDHDHDEDGHSHQHADIEAEYEFNCTAPEQLKALDLSAFFKQFPGTEKFKVQFVGPNGQKGAEVTPANPRFDF